MTEHHEPKPFVIRRDGTLVDRESETVIGKVYISPVVGWVAATPADIFYGGTRRMAARRAWEGWRKAVIPHNHVTRDVKELGKCPACDRIHRGGA